MRWFLTAAIATAALVLANPVPAKGQITIGGYPSYTPRYTVPFTPYTRVVVTPTSTQVVPVSGGPMDFAMNTWYRSLGSFGYGPYAGYYGFANPTSYAPWSNFRPFNAPTTGWNWPQPLSGNSGWNPGSFKFGGKRR